MSRYQIGDMVVVHIRRPIDDLWGKTDSYWGELLMIDGDEVTITLKWDRAIRMVFTLGEYDKVLLLESRKRRVESLGCR